MEKEFIPCEVWRVVPLDDFKNLYEASTFGRIRNIKTGRVLSGRVDKKGYARFCLCDRDKRLEGHRARIIALTFPEICGKWFDGCEVDHINCIRTDDRAINLRVVDHLTNCRNPQTIVNYKNRKLLQYETLPENSKKKCIIDGIVFSSQRDAAEYIGIPESTLSAIKCGRLSNNTGHKIIFT